MSARRGAGHASTNRTIADLPNLPGTPPMGPAGASSANRAASNRTDLADLIGRIVSTTPVRLGPGGADSLVSTLTVVVASWVGCNEIPASPVDVADAITAVIRVRALAEDMRTWCSPHGVAVTYADRIVAALEGRTD